MARSSRDKHHHLVCLLIAMACCASSVVVRSNDRVSDDADESPPEIVITAPEPRFVAPTRRDQIGRIWAPVTINGKGPFRLAFDTGASRSGISANVAERLGLFPNTARSVLLRGAMGSIAVPTVQVESFEVGDVIETPVTLPILPTALGGAEGVLGMEGFVDKRVLIDFRHDEITITRSRRERAPPDFTSIPVERSASNLLVIRALVGGVRVQAFIDKGLKQPLGMKRCAPPWFFDTPKELLPSSLMSPPKLRTPKSFHAHRLNWVRFVFEWHRLSTVTCLYSCTGT